MKLEISCQLQMVKEKYEASATTYDKRLNIIHGDGPFTGELLLT